MKTLSVKKLSVEMPGTQQVTTRDLIKACLDNLPENGYSFEDLKNRQRIEDACEKGDETSIELEDSDAKNLKDIALVMRWAIRHSDIIDFCEQINKL